MRIPKIRIPLILALVYWIPSSFALLDIIYSDGLLFPAYVDDFLMPGYILGFALGFGAGGFWAFIGQLIALVVLIAIMMLARKAISSLRENI